MEKKIIGYRLTWELDGVKQSQLFEPTANDLTIWSEARKWFDMGCKVTIAPAYKSVLIANKKDRP